MTDKVTLSDITSFVNDTSAAGVFNSNMTAITTAIDNTLSRDGTSPNQMGSNLDMNNNQILNLPAPASTTSPVRLVDVAGNPTITVPPVGTSGATVPLLNGNNTWSGTNTFNAASTFTTTTIPWTQTGTGAVARTVDARLKESWFSVMDFGAVGDGVTDDTTAIQAAITAAQSVHFVNEPSGGVYAPSGKLFKVTQGLTINNPIKVDFRSWITTASTSGVVLTINSVSPSLGNQTLDLYFAGFIQTSGNGTTPGSVNSSGLTAIRINSMAFSRLRVDAIQGFTYRAIWCDGTGGVFTPQVILHNTFDLGQIVNNGQGIYMNSVNAATSSCEVCRWNIQNIYQNFTNIRMDNAASTSHTFNINSMDNCNAGGFGIQCFGGWNSFIVGYTACPIRFESGAANNFVRVGNTQATGVSFVDVDGYGTSRNNLFSAGVDYTTQMSQYLGLGNAWSAYTPTIGSGTGTLTTTSATGRFNQIGKQVIFEVAITITTNGTGATSITCTLPGGITTKADTVLTGRARAVSGKAITALALAGTSTLSITNYDNTYPAANGEVLVICGIFEAA